MVTAIKKTIAWLALHPWPIIAALGSALALLLFRRAPGSALPGTENELAAAQNTGRADAHLEQAQALEPEAHKAEQAISQEEKILEKIGNEPETAAVEKMSDEKIADLFGVSGL
jgi:hypothetical protein